MSKPANFAAPEDVEQAFYEAVQKGDADLLIQFWAEDEETLCVHPTGVRLLGIVPITLFFVFFELVALRLARNMPNPWLAALFQAAFTAVAFTSIFPRDG